jgi:putative RecB family exonuclease
MSEAAGSGAARSPGPAGQGWAKQEPAGQQMLAGMPARLYPCTPTRLTTWLDCPRRYRFSYLERPPLPKGPPWAHNSVGAAVHSALADWWTQPFPRRTPQAGETAVRRRWLSEGFADETQSARVRDLAIGWVREYLSRVDAAQEPVGIERVVSTPTRRLVLSGRADRIDERPDDDGGRSLVVVDYKTGRYQPGPDDARSSLALAIYAVAAARTLRRRCHRVELHHLPSGTVAAAEHGEAGLARKVAEAESIAADCSAADARWRQGLTAAEVDQVFPPRPSSGCSWCDWRRHCPQGQAAAPDVEPWATLP